MTELLGLADDVRAHERLGISKDAYRDLVEALAETMAAEDLEIGEPQLQADREEAEWMLGILYATGFKPVPVTS